MKQAFFIIIIFILITQNLSAGGQKKISIGLTEIKVTDVDKYYAQEIYNFLETRLIKHFVIKNRKDKNIFLDEMALSGKKLNFDTPDFFLFGTFMFDKEKKKYILSLRVYEKDNFVYGSTERMDKVEDYKDAIENLLYRIIANINDTVENKNTTLLNQPPFYLLDFKLLYFLPFSEFKKICDYGLGGTIRAVKEIKFIQLGLETGFFNFSGNDSSTDRMSFVPLFVNLRYRFLIFDMLNISPEIFGGPSMLISKGFNNENEMIEKTILGGGLSFGILIKKSIFVDFSSKLFYFIEKDKNIYSLSFSAGVSFIL